MPCKHEVRKPGGYIECSLEGPGAACVASDSDLTQKDCDRYEEEEGETTEPSTVADLRRRYNEAVERGEESFTLDGLDFLTSYAKYVLQYLDMNNIPDSDKLRDRIKPQEER